VALCVPDCEILALPPSVRAQHPNCALMLCLECTIFRKQIVLWVVCVSHSSTDRDSNHMTPCALVYSYSIDNAPRYMRHTLADLNIQTVNCPPAAPVPVLCCLAVNIATYLRLIAHILLLNFCEFRITAWPWRFPVLVLFCSYITCVEISMVIGRQDQKFCNVTYWFLNIYIKTFFFAEYLCHIIHCLRQGTTELFVDKDVK
jgi:hypothetical protein